MMKVPVMVVCCVATVWLQLPSGANGECCKTHPFTTRTDSFDEWKTTTVCDDCYEGTPYCGYGSCNIFGCNCDGSCRSGACRDFKFSFQKSRALRMRSDDARDVIRAADVDGDGRMSLEEALLHLASTGLPADHVKRALEQLDYDQDQFITAQEIDADSK